MDFTGKTYIVAGGASGIGLATAIQLLSLGASVHIIDLAASALKSFEEYDSDSVTFHPGVDVSSREQVSQVFEKIAQQSPDIHGLVNSAGIAPKKTNNFSLPEPDEHFHRIMAVNCTGTWNTATAYFRYLLQKYPELAVDISTLQPREGLGSVVNISSIAALREDPGLASYSASKHGVVSLTKTWAKEYVKRGVRVNCVAPGAVDTPMTPGGIVDPAIIKMIEKTVPMGRTGRPEEIANTIVFLLSDLSSYTTGQVIAVEGALL